MSINDSHFLSVSRAHSAHTRLKSLWIQSLEWISAWMDEQSIGSYRRGCDDYLWIYATTWDGFQMMVAREKKNQFYKCSTLPKSQQSLRHTRLFSPTFSVENYYFNTFFSVIRKANMDFLTPSHFLASVKVLIIALHSSVFRSDSHLSISYKRIHTQPRGRLGPLETRNRRIH